MGKHRKFRTIVRRDKIDGDIVNKDKTVEMKSNQNADTRVTECKMEG